MSMPMEASPSGPPSPHAQFEGYNPAVNPLPFQDAETMQCRGVWAEFYHDWRLNRAESDKAGRPVYDKVEMIRIHTVGSRLNVPVHRVTPRERARFAQAYKTFAQSGQTRHEGTPLEQYPPVTRDRVQLLKFHNVHTVEQLAEVKDNDVQGVIGLDGYAVRESARAWLEQSKETAKATKTGRELAQLREENREAKERNEELQGRLETLMSQMQNMEKRFAAMSMERADALLSEPDPPAGNQGRKAKS